MTSVLSSLGTLSDRDLLTQVERTAGQERQATARLVALLMEVDARKLYAQQGCSSLFTYCVQALHLSEHAAYLRIEAARAAQRFPAILKRLDEGSLHLTAVSLLAPHLPHANHVEILDAARHQSKRDVEQLVARVCHHVVPYADGGATTCENLEVRCRTHNVYEAEQHVVLPAQPCLVRETRAVYGMRLSTRSSPDLVRCLAARCRAPSFRPLTERSHGRIACAPRHPRRRGAARLYGFRPGHRRRSIPRVHQFSRR